MEDDQTLGRIGYEAYAKSTGGKTFDGRPMPTFDEICERSPHVARAWQDAGTAVAIAEIARGDLARPITPPAADGIDFGAAIHALKAGRRVARAGWNGKNMWVALTPGSEIPIGSARPGAAGHLASEEAGRARDIYDAEARTIRICPHLDMRAADGSLVIGWLASQTDVLAEDWTVVP